MKQETITISEVLTKIDKNEFLLPAIQRNFVWKTTQIELLFDSIMRDYPIGSLLLWYVKDGAKENYRFYKFLSKYIEDFETTNPEINANGLSDFYAVLDGQQRLTSIYLGLKGSYGAKPKYKPNIQKDQIMPSFLFLDVSKKLKENEDDKVYNFEFKNREQLQKDKFKGKWIKIADLVGKKTIEDFEGYVLEKKISKNTLPYNMLKKLHSKIHDAKLFHYFLETEQDLIKALNIFIRANSGGTKLSLSDLLISITIAHWNNEDARSQLNGIVDTVRKKNQHCKFSISTDFALKVFLVLFSDDIKFKVQNFDKQKALQFEENWTKIKDAIIEVFDLAANFGYTDKSLTSKNALIPIIVYIFEKEIIEGFATSTKYEDERKIIKRWLNIVILKRTFGDQADGVLKTISDVVKNAIFMNSDNNFPITAIQDKLKTSANKSLVFRYEEIENYLDTYKYKGRYTFSLLSLLYPNVDLKNKHHIDHIHSQEQFKSKNYGNQRINNDRKKNFEKYKDTVLNLQLIDDKTNLSKGKKVLETWISETNVNLAEQLIPSEYIKFTEFDDFIKKRKDMIIEKLKELLTIEY